MRRILFCTVASLALLAAPAAAARHQRTPAIDYTPAPPPAVAAPAANGSIFQASMGYAPLTSGARAAQVGDLITITLVESTQAANQDTAQTSRAGNIGITPPTTGPLSFFSASDASAGGTNTFNGQGKASQSASLTGQISVTIAAVYPNGNMLVRGQKQLHLNRGDEIIQLQGIVRAADIGFDNTVLSTRVADARISYSGRGDVHRAAHQGWLQRFFTVVSPF